MAKVSIDIVRAKGIPQAEDAYEAPTTCIRMLQIDTDPALIAAGSAQRDPSIIHTFCTRTVANCCDPFFNDTTEFGPSQSPEQLLFAHLVIEVRDAVKDAALYYGTCSIECKPNGKGERTVELSRRSPLIPSDSTGASGPVATGEGPASGPTLLLRFRTSVPKPKKEVIDVNADIDLPEAPRFNGERALIPKDAPYVWWHLVHDEAWVAEFTSVLIETIKAADAITSLSGTQGSLSLSQSPKKSGRGGGSAGAERSGGSGGGGAALKNLGDVIHNKWRCRRTHQVITKLRLSATKFAHGVVPITAASAEEELAAKVRYLEHALIREDMLASTTDSAAGKTREKLNRLWMLFAAGIPTEGQAPYINYELSSKLEGTPFGRPQQEVLQACLLRFLVPSLSQQAAQAIAKEDAEPQNWDHSPVRAPAALDATLMASTGSAFSNASMSAASSPAAPAAAATATGAAGAAPATATGTASPASPMVSSPTGPTRGKEKEKFLKLIRRFACRIVDTLTEFEFGALLDSLVSPITEARELCKALAPAPLTSTLGGGRVPAKPSSAKASAGGGRGRRKSSAAGGSRKASESPRKPADEPPSGAASAPPSAAAAASGGGDPAGLKSSGSGTKEAPRLAGPLHIKHLDELGRPQKH